jgi:tryptophanyl-tRNA synthetase
MYNSPKYDKNHHSLETTEAARKFRVVSGTRSTGRLHLGNYHGALKNWMDLQSKNDQYECFFFIADWHALTTEYERPQFINQCTREVLLDWLGVGLDSEQSTLFIQSHVPEHAELHLLFSMITPLSWLERVPTYKELRQKLHEKHLATYGFLGYPALQAADILIYKGKGVPVGEDQVSHIELTREIARHFNHLYCKERSFIFSEPQALLTKASKIPGLDGQKMSKSYHNTIELREDPASIEHKIKVMPTDPARVRRSDPGEPEKCPVWRFHQVYSSPEVQGWVQNGCRSAGIGCLECKRPVIDAVLTELAPIRQRAAEFAQDEVQLQKIMKQGSEYARSVAQETLKEVREVMGLTGTL